MSIRKQLYLSFGVILAMVLILLAVNLVAVWREHSAKAAAQRAIDMTEAVSTVRFQMSKNNLHLQNYLLSGDTRDVEKMNDGEQALVMSLRHAVELVNSDKQRTSLEKVIEQESGWVHEFAEPLVDRRRAVDSGNATVAELQIFYLQKDPSSFLSRSSDILDEVDRENRDLLQKRQADDQLATTATIVISVLSSFFAFVVGAIIAYRKTDEITEPLNRLIQVAEKIGQSGELDHNIDVHGKDEIGQLARTFDSMVKYLKEMAAVSEAIAGGNLAVEVHPRSANDTLANAFRRMVEGLRGLVRNGRDAAAQVASAATQVATSSDESAQNSLQTSSAIDEVTSTMHEMSVNVQNMVKSTQTQASSVSETSASIDQMVTSIQRVADTAKVLLDISNRSREEVHSGLGTMEKATDGLNRINTTIRSAGSIIDSLGTRADDIGKIIEVIDDLAEQTNLLALNAAIEAARAGEHGLGFAVVADEVRKLAEKSAQSTKEISELIQSIQREARKAVDNMENSTAIVNEGLNLGQDLNAALRKISNVVTEVYKFAHEIGAATNEQSHGSTQIARATARLNEITHEINSAVEEQASGAQAVVQAMERMRTLVQASTSGSTELAASADQMSKMSRALLESMDRFSLQSSNGNGAVRQAATAGAR